MAAGCGNDALTALLTQPTVTVTVTDTFTGTVGQNGATSHPFPVVSTGGGDVIVSLKTVSPDAGAVIGLSLGTWNGTACQAVISNDRATVSSAILGRATTTGTLCVRVFDVGALTEPQDYEVEVVHP
ncbi:MAG TPA: hypothetical protein VMW48_10730 [Vicinamibacterales bacterium]|nr:hypothetical protein [Vicinamibacterales bacterium]